MNHSRLTRIVAGAAVIAVALTALVATPAQAVNTAPASATSVALVTGSVRLAPTSTAPTGSVAVSWRALDSTTSKWGAESAPTLVGEGGKFSIPLPPGRYDFRYVPTDSAGDYVESPFRADLVTAITVSSADVVLAERALYPRNSLNGRVTLGLAAPAPAAAGDVKVTPRFRRSFDVPWTRLGDRAVVTAAGGWFSIPVTDDGHYALDYEWVGSSGQSFEPVTEVRSSVFASSRGFVADLNWSMRRLASVTGRIFLGERSQPAQAGEVRVTASSGGHAPSRSVLTTAAGEYTIDGLAEGWWDIGAEYIGEGLYVDRPVFATQLAGVPVVGADAVLAAKEGIGGVVTDSAGVPIPAVAVHLLAHRDDGGADYAGLTYTDGDGAYEFLNVDTSRVYSMTFDHDGYVHQQWYDSGRFYEPWYFTLDEGEMVTDADAVLYRPATVRGTVAMIGMPAQASQRGEVQVEVLIRDAASGRWVEAHDTYGTTHLYIADDGSYSIEDLPPDDYRVRVSYAGIRGQAVVTGPVLNVAEGASVSYSTSIRPFQRDLDARLFGGFSSDVVARNSAGALMLYAGNGSGGFLRPRQIGSGWSRFTAIVHAGDFSADGKPDVIARDASGGLWLYKGDGVGGWLGSVKIGSGWNGQNTILSPGDFNGDGFADLISRDSKGALWLWRGTSAGTIRTPALKVGSGWGGFTALRTAGDMNEDGYPDVLGRDGSGQLWLYPGNGSGGWKPRVKLGAGWASMTEIFGIGDFDGDLHSDVVARDVSGYLWLYPGDGAGALGVRTRIGSGWKSLVIVK